MQHNARVFVYRNLHKSCWSIKALSGPDAGRVIAHAAAISLRDCRMRVSEAGRQRVIRERKKYVHAGVVGTIQACDGLSPRYETGEILPVDTVTKRRVGVTYNPFERAEFYRREDKSAVTEAGGVTLDTSGKMTIEV